MMAEENNMRSEEEINSLYLEYDYLIDYWIKQKYGSNVSGAVKDDLYSYGAKALYDAAKNYDPDNEEGAAFKTYASTYIKLSFANYWKTKKAPAKRTDGSLQPPMPDSFVIENKGEGENPCKKADRRALQILEVLRMFSDEKHALTIEDIMLWRNAYCYEKHGFAVADNKMDLDKERRTITTTLDNMVAEYYPGKMDFSGYDRDISANADEDDDGEDKKKNAKGYRCVHPFSYDDMNKLIEAVCFTDMLTSEEKTELIKKVFATASDYYESPFWDKEAQKIRFNPKALHGRLSRKFGGRSVADNNSIVQRAIAGKNWISFKFNHYTEDLDLECNKDYKTGEDRIYKLRPYHLVVYHDNYYCLGFHEGSENIYHYRVDLMSDIEIVLDEEGRPVREKTVPIDDYTFVGDFWNPESYMAEHIYMAYGDPRDIKIKIDNRDRKGFTFLHDWFGEHFEVLKPAQGKNDPDSILVSVRADPKMIVHWAMQYAGLVEVLDKEVRGLINEELEMLKKKYS